MEVILYSTGCPKCQVLEKKLSQKSISFEKNTDLKLMLSKGIKSAPCLEIDGKIFDFKNATEWVNKQ